VEQDQNSEARRTADSEQENGCWAGKMTRGKDLGSLKAVFVGWGRVVRAVVVVVVATESDAEHVGALAVVEEKAAYSHVRSGTQHALGSLASNVMTAGAHVAAMLLVVVTLNWAALETNLEAAACPGGGDKSGQ
jgi:hypothetical protein